MKSVQTTRTFNYCKVNFMHSFKQLGSVLNHSLKRFALSACVALSACSVLPDKYDSTLEWSETKLFEEAQDALNNKDYTNAAKYFEAFEGRYPLSPKARQALFNTAYSYYKDGDKALATQTLSQFIDMYPNHESIDYAFYLRGLVYFNDNLGILGRFAQDVYDERDPASMKKSYDAFKTLVERFPKSQYTPDALDRMRFIVNSLAMHELKIARYYYQRGAYLAASQRAENILVDYDRAPAMEEALYILSKSYELLKLPEQSEKAKTLLMTNFPKSSWLNTSKK